MMPKPSKMIKKGFDPPSNMIALGSRSKESTSSTTTTTTTTTAPVITSTTTTLTSIPTQLNDSTSTTTALKQAQNNSNSTSNLLNNSSTSCNNANNNGNSNQTTEMNSVANNNNNNAQNSSKITKLTSNNSSSNLISLANNNSNNNNNNNNNNSSSNNSNNNQYYLDSKTVKDEITKALEKEENDKLIKIIKSLIVNLKNSSSTGASVLLTSNNLNKPTQQSQQQPPPQQQQQQQPDLNFLMALSYVALKRPQLFIKQNSLVEFICTNLLFTNKNPVQDKQTTPLGGSVLKSRSLQSLRPPSSPQQNLVSIQPLICNMLSFIYENEITWPEIFVKAYVDDSLGERSWVDSPLCKEFVDNIKTAFSTKPIPFAVENSSLNNNIVNNSNSNSSSDMQSLTKNNCEDSLLEISGGLIDFPNKKTQIMPRYASIRNEIEILLVDIIRNYISNSKREPIKRSIGQINSISSTSNTVNSIDNRNFLKLLQNTCGFGEIRAIALNKLEAWLLNPKLDSCAQDLLLAICVNCNQGDQADKDLIAHIIKIKPKLKQQQHYSDCIRELVKLNSTNLETLIQLTVRNELIFQQHNLQQQQQLQQQQTITSSKNSHNLNLLQISCSTDSSTSVKILAQTFLKVILQRNGDDHLRALRILLRDTVRYSRQDFDLIKFTSELVSENLVKKYFFSFNDLSHMNSTCILFSVAGGLADFSQIQTRERFVSSICDLITVCILVSITPQIKEAYLKRTHETRDILINYYMLMSQIQSDAVTWLQSIFRTYEITAPELIRCLFKILFMVEKPEQSYTIDNWPNEQERSTMFGVVSEIPVLSETLHQVLMMTQSLPEHMYMLMLCVEENLLKTAALVHINDIYSLKLNKIEQFVDTLFNICLYKYQNPPSLVVTVLYWRAWQILLLISSIDPKGFGRTAWEKYPTLRLLMEMIMTEDFNFPPQSSITEEMTNERFRAIEAQACLLEKQDILKFENMYEMNQGLGVKNESNSKLIGQVMKFEPSGTPRRPTTDTIQNIRKLNAKYKLGQLLCKNRQPDFLLALIKRQNSKLSLPWLSSLIESSSDCLEIMPIQCICEFVWNLLSGTEEEIPLKKQINLEQLINRIKTILTTEDLNDSTIIQQITDTFDYFLNKLCSDKQAIRNGALKIFNRLFLTSNCILDRLQIPPLPGQLQHQQNQQQQVQIDLEQLLNSFKQLSAYDICLKPLLIKYFRRAIMVETNPNHLNLYLYFLFKQLLKDYKQQNELESSLKMELDEAESLTDNADLFPILIKSDAFKTTYNEIGIDFADFFFKRDYYLNTVKLFKFDDLLLTSTVKPIESLEDLINFKNFILDFSTLLFKLNELKQDDESNLHLIQNRQEFKRNNLELNSYLLIEFNNSIAQSQNQQLQQQQQQQKLVKLNEKIQNLTSLNNNSQLSDSIVNQNQKSDVKNLFNNFTSLKFLNCTFDQALNDVVKDKLLKMFNNIKSVKCQLNNYFLYSSSYSCSSSLLNESSSYYLETALGIRLIETFLDSIKNNLNELFDYLLNKYGLSFLSVFLIVEKLELYLKSKHEFVQELSQICDTQGIGLKRINDVVQTYVSKLRLLMENDQELCKYVTGFKLIDELNKLKDKKVVLKSTTVNGTSDIEMQDGDKNHKDVFKSKIFSFSKEKCKKLEPKIYRNELNNHNDLITNTLTNIQCQIDSLKKENRLKFDDTSMPITLINDESTSEESENKLGLVKIINESTNQNLELNLNKKLNDLNIEDRILNLSESILSYENKKNECLKRSKSTTSKIVKLDNSFNNDETKKLTSTEITYKRCIIDILLDYFCHFDSQIINKQFDIEFRLLFELRNLNLNHSQSEYQTESSSALTQSFLLSLFIHQANWQKLYDCVLFILKDHSFFCKHTTNMITLNPTIILDFLSSLINIPELWKGTESKISKKSHEENVLVLNEKQICYVLDFIIEEMFIIYEKNRKIKNLRKTKTNQTKQVLTDNSLNLSNNDTEEDDNSDLNDLKLNLDKRVALLKNLFQNKFINREKLFDIILAHLQKQKVILNKILNLTASDNEINNYYFKLIQNDFEYNNTHLNNSTKHFQNVLYKIQTFFMYRIYLEENSFIYHITDSNRLFINFYFQIDKPTELDLKAHNLLNCFGEIEVNLSNNITSSGIIGVAVTGGHKKQENQELVIFSKKQEAFMADANLVCIKLASSHPFIFIRQLPMMEGLLQGRVGYSFDEFKKRKFDKLFHYIIDLLNILVPYVFHQKYLEQIESIISHYFDVFMAYCGENREFIGSLVIKFVDFLEKFINSDIKIGYALVIRKYSQFISFLQKSYPELNSLKYLNSIQSIPFESIESLKTTSKTDLLKSMPTCLKNVNNLNKKLNMPIWSSKQLEPFINKLSNRNNYESVLSVLQELDAVSQRQPIMLSHFVMYLQPLIQDKNDLIRDLAISLIMRHLRLNPKETPLFFQAFLECLNSQNSKVFNSVIKYFPDFNLLCSENSQSLIKSALKGSYRHNIDISKHLTDSIRLLHLEKYVY